jgi:hypothetical protein
MVEAPLARDGVGRNPTDRGKKGTKGSMVVESPGLPAGVTRGGANRHDIKLLEETLQSIVTPHPEGANVCLDAGYVGAQKIVEGMGYKAQIRSRGEKKEEKEKEPRFKARRWVVEFACAVIIWRHLIPIHPGLIPG